MATHLKVLELRAELSKRSLDTSCTKPTLVRRLEEARSKEGIVKDDDAPNTRAAKKRERVDEDGINEEIGNGSDEICEIEKLQGMNIQKLRKEASKRGVSSIGTKKEIIQRLCDSSALDGDGIFLTIFLPIFNY